MKVIKKTRKYLHVRMTEEEFGSAKRAIKAELASKEAEKEREAYNQWFADNFECHSWSDEYSEWHEEWKHKETGEVRQPPRFFFPGLYGKSQ